jgi:predicted transcriptional regulator
MMPPFSLTESASIARAAALMSFEGVHRVVIIDVSGVVVGVLSSLDILRWVAQSSGYVLPG